MGQSVDCPCEKQEMNPQQLFTNVVWLIGVVCLFSVSCQGDGHIDDEDYAAELLNSLRTSFSKRSSYQKPYGYNNYAWWWYTKRAPGSEFLGKRAPGSEFLGKWAPGSEFLGKRVPGSEFLGKRAPGSGFLGKRGHQLDYAHNVMQEANHPKGSLEVPLMPLQ